MPEIEEEKQVEETDDGDEVIVPGTGTKGEEETPAPSSGEEKTEGTEEKSEEEEPVKASESEEETEEPVSEGEPDEPVKKEEPKPVAGETPRENALRLEVERVKAKLRQERGKKLLGDVQPQKATAPTELTAEDQEALKAYDPEQVANLEKVFGVLAKKQGYVKKDEFNKQNYQTTSQEVFDSWMENHPEYSEDNDPNGILWNRFKEEFNLYVKPENPKTYVKIFNKIHNEIFGITTKPKETPGQAKAKQEKIQVASAGSKASVAPKKGEQLRRSASEQQLSQLARGGALQGFTQEEIEEMGL